MSTKSGKPHTLIDFTSLVDFFRRKAQGNPARVVYQNTEDRTTDQSVGDLYEASLKVADFLLSHGLQRGARVALLSKNRPEWLAIYMGIINAGCCALPIDIHLTGLEVKNLIRDSKAQMIFIERDLFASVRDMELEQMADKFVILDAEINYLSRCIPFGWILKNDASRFQPVEACLEDEASLIYTSGTTGNPKGVILKHKNLLSQVVVRDLLGSSKRSRVLLILPLNHPYAFACCFLGPLMAGAGIYILNSLKSTDLLGFMQKYRTTVMVFVPAILTQFHKGIMEQINLAPNYVQLLFHFLKTMGYVSCNASHLGFLKRRIFKKVHGVFGGRVEYFASGAAGLDEEIMRVFNTLGLPIYEGYGLTETSPIIAVNHPAHNKPGTVGRPLKGVEIKIVSAAANGVGEIAVKGAPVFDGYKGEHSSEDTFTPDGYFLTGDLGSIDRNGFLTISGRSKDVIVLPSGKNVFPEEIEEFYLQSECFKEMAVLGIPRELGKKAEEIYALVVPHMEFFRANRISDIEDFVKNAIIEMSDRLPGWCRINRYEIRYESLPKTATNKIKKFVLREEILERMSRSEKKDVEVAAEALLNTPIGRILEAAIVRIKGCKMEYSLRSHLFLDLGFDSLSVSELIVALEAAIGNVIPKEIAYQMRTISDCITLLNDFCSQHQINVEVLALSDEGGSGAKTSWSDVLRLNVPPEMEREIGQRLHNRTRFGGFIRRIFVGMSSVLSKLLFRFSVEGIERLPKEPPFILAADHFSFFDALFVLWSLPARFQKKFFCIGAREHLLHIGRVFFAWLTGMIPVDREGNFVPSLQAGKKVIDSGHILLIFPEGTRSRDAFLSKFKNGVGILAETTNVPIVPIHLQGTFDVLSSDRKMPRFSRVRAFFGMPVLPLKVIVHDGSEKYEAITEEVKQRIINLGARPRTDNRADLLQVQIGDRG